MKIAFAVSGFPQVSETFMLRQVAGLIDAGHEVTVFASRRPEGKTHELFYEYEMENFTVYTDAPSSYTGAIAKILTLIPKIVVKHPEYIPELVKSLKFGKEAPERITNIAGFLDHDEEFDIIHAHFGTTGKRWSFSTREEFEGKYVVSFYGHDVSRLLKGKKYTYDELFSYTDNIIVLSQDMRQRVEELGCEPDKIFEVPTGLDISDFPYKERSKQKEEDYKLLTVARFTEKKGIIYGLEAVSELKEEYDITYNIIGDGERREEIERKIEEKGLHDEVNLLGYREHSEVKDYLYNSHILLAPSVTASDGDKEGLPVIILEAQATGMPVLSTYHAGIPEAVKDKKTGSLVPERDVNELKDGLEYLLNSVEEWPRLGEKGREIVDRKYSASYMIEKLERVYG